jgi:hypothetical protein
MAHLILGSKFKHAYSGMKGRPHWWHDQGYAITSAYPVDLLACLFKNLSTGIPAPNSSFCCP